MCRFAVYLGPPIRLAALLNRTDHSLVSQAQHSYQSTEETNPDGWGVAWYVPHLVNVPAVYKDVTPAWRSKALPAIARGMRSRLILAHVRAATEGFDVRLENCHPFVWQQLTFMHNGSVEDFERLRPELWERLSPEARELVHGTTDSEHVFALFVDRWRESEARLPLERLADATRRTLAELDAVRLATGCEAPAFVNLAVSDGNVVVVSRATLGSQKPARSLYVRTGERPARDGDDPERMEPFAVVASEPLELTAAWRPLRTGELVLVDEERRVFLEPIEASAVRRRVA